MAVTGTVTPGNITATIVSLRPAEGQFDRGIVESSPVEPSRRSLKEILDESVLLLT